MAMPSCDMRHNPFVFGISEILTCNSEILPHRSAYKGMQRFKLQGLIDIHTHPFTEEAVNGARCAYRKPYPHGLVERTRTRKIDEYGNRQLIPTSKELQRGRIGIINAPEYDFRNGQRFHPSSSRSRVRGQNFELFHLSGQDASYKKPDRNLEKLTCPLRGHMAAQYAR
jgi:hypothetical protein